MSRRAIAPFTPTIHDMQESPMLTCEILCSTLPHFKTFNLSKMTEAVSDDMLEQITIAGTPEECREQLKKWNGFLDLPILYTPTTGVSSARIMENHKLIVETFAK